MRKSMKSLFLALLCGMLFSALFVIPVSAAFQVKKVVNYADSTKTFYADMTGNGKSDKVQVILSKNLYDSLKTVKINISGKTALSLDVENGYCYGVSVYYIKMSSSKIFLQVMAHSDNDYLTLNKIYRYDKSRKKLTSVLNLASSGRHTAYSVSKIKGNTIQVSNRVQPQETGWIHWTDTYKYSNGRFVKTSKKAAVKSSLGTSTYPGDGLETYFAKNKYKTAKRLTFYTSTSQKKVAFTVPKGKFVTLKNIYVNGNNYYLQFSYGGKTGWRKMFNQNVYDYSSSDWSKSGWFLGVANRLAG